MHLHTFIPFDEKNEKINFPFHAYELRALIWGHRKKGKSQTAPANVTFYENEKDPCGVITTRCIDTSLHSSPFQKKQKIKHSHEMLRYSHELSTLAIPLCSLHTLAALWMRHKIFCVCVWSFGATFLLFCSPLVCVNVTSTTSMHQQQHYPRNSKLTWLLLQFPLLLLLHLCFHGV